MANNLFITIVLSIAQYKNHAELTLEANKEHGLNFCMQISF